MVETYAKVGRYHSIHSDLGDPIRSDPIRSRRIRFLVGLGLVFLALV